MRLLTVANIEFILAIPLAVIMTIGVAYLVSFIILGPILLPLSIAMETGSFVLPFILVNVAGVSGVCVLVLVDKYLDTDRVLIAAVLQIMVLAVIAGAYYYG